MATKKRKTRIPVETAKDSALNTRIDYRKKAALMKYCRSNYRTLSSLVQEFVDQFIELNQLEIPSDDQAAAILSEVK